MKKAALTFGAALVAFLGVILWQFPAAWARSFLPKTIVCSDLAGTVWNGQCMSLVANGAPIGDLTWNLSPWRVLTGKAVGDVALTRANLALAADIALDFTGDGKVSNLKARFPLDPAVLPQLPPYLRGDVSADFPQVVIASRWPTELKGTLSVRELRRLDGAQFRLGNYDLAFDGAAAVDGTLVGQLQDRGGPLAVRGTVKLTREPGYEVTGLVGVRADAPAPLRQQLEILGPANANGEREFSIAGTFE